MFLHFLMFIFRTFKMYSRNTKTTKEPTASNNKSDRPQVKIWDTWKTLQYLNINDSFHLKDRQGRHLSTKAENETRYIQYGQILLFQ
jgi:hypothetical protein